MLYKNIEVVNGNTIKTLVEKSEKQHTKIKNLYERYKQTDKGTPILTRTYKIDKEEQKDKINNKLANDFMGEIVDMKVGFFCGVPISYTLDKTDYQETTTIEIPPTKEETITSPSYQEHLDLINDFNKQNSIPDLDVETAKRASICGYAGRLIYIDAIDKELKIKLIEPWELIFIGESIEKPDYTIRYYDTIKYLSDGKEQTTSHAEIYSASQVEFYIKDNNKQYVLDSQNPPVPQYWNSNPLFGFANNDEMLGDAEKVLTLIDGYDRSLSDINSELEQFRLAYLVFLGCSIDDPTLEKAKKTGAFSLPGDGADMKFVVKNLVDAIIEHHLDRLERNIYRFSKTPNMNDESFAGQITGVALKYRLRSFEDKCQVAELKFKKALQSQYEKLTKIWADQGNDIDPMSIDYIFTRNYPQNLVEEAQWLRDTKGIVSEETRFANVSFIDDPQKEIEKLEAEEQENLDNFIQRNETMMANAKDNSVENNPPDNIKNAISNQAST